MTVAPQNNQNNTTRNEAEFVNCNQFPDQQRCSQRGSPLSRRIPVHTLSSRRTGQKWRISTSNKPKSPQSVPSERDIQNGESHAINTVRSILRPGDFMMKMDLKDGYYVVPIYPHHRKYLRYQFERVTYEFQCFPFSLASAPRAFTKLLKPIVAVIRSKGIRIVIFLDDLLIMHQGKVQCQKIFSQVTNLLSNLGFLIKQEKCSSCPTQQIIFLGALLNTISITIALPEEKMEFIVQTSHQMHSTHQCSLQELSTLLGRMSHAAQTGVSTAPLHYRMLQMMHIEEIQRCGFKSKKHILQLPDSSGGHWGPLEAKQHINALELKAAYLALQSFLSQIHPLPRHILLEMDSTTAVAYLNKRGGTHSTPLSDQALQIWEYVLNKESRITARHIPGVLNVEADLASREFNPHTEWMLDKTIFKKITVCFFVPEIDLFASRFNHQVPLYMSPDPDPGSMAFDTFKFRQSFGRWKSFIHPPVVLLSRIIQKVRQDKATTLLVAPNWPRQPWYLKLCQMLIDHPLQLPIKESLLTLPFRPGMTHPLWRSLRHSMANIRKRYRTAGLSSEVIKILLSSWSPATQNRVQCPLEYLGPVVYQSWTVSSFSTCNRRVILPCKSDDARTGIQNYCCL